MSNYVSANPNITSRQILYLLALATDYDGTLAHDGVVAPETCVALRRLKESGRKLILVTGRELPDLERVFPEMALFDRVVAENGALSYDPLTEKETILASPPPASLVQALRQRDVAPLSVGRVIIATWEPHQATVLDVIRELGLEQQILFNKGAIMVLPPGVNKASGLLAALNELDLSPHNVVSVGDGENDHSLLKVCGCAAAVANALPVIKAEADIILTGDHGAGVVELIEAVIRQDAGIVPRARHSIAVGTDSMGNEVSLDPFGGSVLIVGPSGCGKSTLVTTLTERMVEKDFDFFILDPEGDYFELENAVCVGNAAEAPHFSEALQLRHDGEVNLVINMQALSLAGRRALFSTFMSQTSQLRAATGRPHWLVIDEAHEVLPATRQGQSPSLQKGFPATILVTLYPEALATEALASVDVILVFGDAAPGTLAAFARATGTHLAADPPNPGCGEVLYWSVHSSQAPFIIKTERPFQVHKRHVGKYATGNVGESRAFYFRGPTKLLNIPADNLFNFIEIAFQIDDTIWDYHLRAGDYSAWFRNVIKDEALTREADAVERNRALDPQESRRLIKKAVLRRYAAPYQACCSSVDHRAARSLEVREV